MRRLFLFLAACLSFGLAAPATAYSDIIVFGDSLVDSGNARRGSIAAGLGDPAPPQFGYYRGRFSNGYNFADYLNLGYFGHPSKAYLKGGRNVGVGGATAQFTPGELSPSFLPQLGLFQSAGHVIKPNSLVIVTFGGNDVRDVLTDPLADFTQSLLDFTTGIQGLLGAGAQNILITGLPDIGALPATLARAALLGDPTIATLATSRAQALNIALANIATSASLLSGADVDFFDLYGLELSLRANPAAFGLPALDASTPCLIAGPAAVLSGCTGYLYFDSIHPTTQVHAVIAGSMAQQLGIQAVPEPASWGMMILGFGLIGGLLRRPSGRLRFA